MSKEREALAECSLRLAESLAQIERMEFLLAQALAHCQRRERPTEEWEENAQMTLRVLREKSSTIREAEQGAL